MVLKDPRAERLSWSRLMEKENEKIEIRDLRNGGWYWIHKAVIRRYAQKVGAIGIAVYNFLSSLADSSQECFPSQRYIAKSLGYSRATINKTVKVLERNGLIRIMRRNRYHCIYLLLKVRCQPGETQMSTVGNSDVNQIDTNDNKLTRINNIDIEDNNFSDSKFRTPKGFRPRNRQELLALDLSKALNDQKSLLLYLSYAKRYPESLLRKILGVVREIPDEKIKKSRGALFNHLIQKHAKKTDQNLSN
jgi:biotin operon repressor